MVLYFPWRGKIKIRENTKGSNTVEKLFSGIWTRVIKKPVEKGKKKEALDWQKNYAKAKADILLAIDSSELKQGKLDIKINKRYEVSLVLFMSPNVQLGFDGWCWEGLQRVQQITYLYGYYVLIYII